VGRVSFFGFLRERERELRLIRRLNLMVSQLFLYIYIYIYIYIGQYTIAMVEVTTQEYIDNISYTVFPI